MLLSGWEKFYAGKTGKLIFPDENVIRLLSALDIDFSKTKALDLGSGYERHTRLLKSMGCKEVTSVDKYCMESKYDKTIADAMNLPFPDQIFDLAIVWGVIHYHEKSMAPKFIYELRRVLSPGAKVVMSIRSYLDTDLKGSHNSNDSFLTEKEEILGAQISLFSLDEVKCLLCEFSDLKIGLTSRSIIGDLSKTISH